MSYNQDIVLFFFFALLYFILLILLFIFVIFPLFTGTVRTFFNAVHPDEKLKFTDIFKTFTRGRWLKAVKLGAIITALIILLQFLYGLVKAIYFSFIDYISPLKSYHYQPTLVSVTIYLLFFGSIMLFILILVTNIWVAFSENTQRKLKEIIKLGWCGIFNKQKTFLLFFIGLYILHLPLILIDIVTEPFKAYIAGSDRNAVSIIIDIIFYFVSFLFYFFIMGTIVQYMVKRGNKETAH
ncbi:hypothetical protein [Staphylococcus ratti]|uniref:Uncharacterized protein n=1 Tax=Staphylococcus ratti TaxID=2892440 RepID=A0ABY3PE97_9STAP|nr:hypothetical protein [Staphylococcus ratti]UEX90652.1 hypothetical protein LN051_03055 [Staphylococcus ratti]